MSRVCYIGCVCHLYNGTAPVEVASTERTCHRLNGYGDRRLNSAIYTIAMVQVRMPKSSGRRYYDRKIAAGKTSRGAMRSLKRHLSNQLWRVMVADERHHATTPASPTTTPNGGLTDTRGTPPEGAVSVAVLGRVARVSGFGRRLR